MKKPEVVMRIEDAWKKLSNTIDKYHEEFLKHNDEEDLADNHIFIWEEADIPFQVGRFLLANQDVDKFQFHLEMNLKRKNFDGRAFSDNRSLDTIKEKLGRNARVDFLVDDMSPKHLAAIGEAKYFRYSIEGISRGKRNVMDAIDEDHEKLKLLVDNDVCKYGIYLVVDKWYHRNDPKKWKEIVKKLEKIESKKIYVFTKEV
jgi:hypothetical protein